MLAFLVNFNLSNRSSSVVSLLPFVSPPVNPPVGTFGLTCAGAYCGFAASIVNSSLNFACPATDCSVAICPCCGAPAETVFFIAAIRLSVSAFICSGVIS